MAGEGEFPKIDGDTLYAEDINKTKELADWGLRQAGQNMIQQLSDRALTNTSDLGFYSEFYSSNIGRQSTVDTNYSRLYDSGNSVYKVDDVVNGPYLVIEATAVSAYSNFEINDCKIREFESGKWVYYCTVGTDEEKRAKLYKSLFFNGRASSTYITDITALKTSVTRDVGKRAYHLVTSGGQPGSNTSTDQGDAELAITFNDTTNNTAFSSWSYCSVAVGASNGGESGDTLWEVPSGTVLNGTTNFSGASDYLSDEIGTDTSADELDNPATARVYARSQCDDINNGSRWTGSTTVIILCAGTISTVESLSGGGGNFSTQPSTSETDYYTDNAIPLLTATTGSEDVNSSMVIHKIPVNTFSDATENSFATHLLRNTETGDSVTYKLTDGIDKINPNSFVEVSATSATPSQFVINDCILYKKSSGVWILGCLDFNNESARAKVYKTLFYGTDGSDPRVTSGFTSITSIKTSVTRDVGKQAHYAELTGNGSNNSTYTGTFANTTTNTDASYWSYCDNNASGSSDETGTNRSADELDNPADTQLEHFNSGDDCRFEVPSGSTLNEDIAGTGNSGAFVKAFYLCVGDITWVASGTYISVSNTDFFTDHSIPLLTSGASLPTVNDSGWLNFNQHQSFTAFTRQPLYMTVKLTPKSTSPTSGYPSIAGVYLVAGVQ